jgi:transcriptional regulatory protein RtcR
MAPERRRTVVIGLLGTTIDDRGAGPGRWESWRPTVALCQHEDLLVDRFELIHPRRSATLAAVVRADIAHVSPETEVRLSCVDVADPWDFEGVYGALHDFARGYRFDPDVEDYLVHITTGTHVAQICLFLLTESRHLPARLVQTNPPAKGRHATGAGTYRVIDLDLSKYDRIASRFAREIEDQTAQLKSGIETRNAAFNALVARLEQVALRSKAPILLLGATGAGKSLLARRIYELKRARRQVQGPFVEVNCATIRGDAAMSALFGHVKGAFTGATRDRPGLLRAADGGVLFLDEVAELGPDEQAMLLRALEDKRFLPLGGDREATSDFQLIAGTNRRLHDEVRAGRFREDLLARINLWTFTLPGLAERREDIAPNLAYELEQFRRRTGTVVTFSKEARERFLAFALGEEAAWPANFRDLNAVVTRLATLAPGGRITAEQVGDEVERLSVAWGAGVASRDGERPEPRPCLVDRVLPRDRADGLDRFERVQLEDVLLVCGGAPSLSAAGRVLFDRSRERKAVANDADRLRKYLARFGLDFDGLKRVLPRETSA